MVAVRRFDVYLVSLDPTVGAEMQKTRPCVIVSPDQLNRYTATVIVAPLTSKGINYPTRVALTFQSKRGQVVLDQIRAVDKRRLVERLGGLSATTAKLISERLVELFTF